MLATKCLGASLPTSDYARSETTSRAVGIGGARVARACAARGSTGGRWVFYWHRSRQGRIWHGDRGVGDVLVRGQHIVCKQGQAERLHSKVIAVCLIWKV